MKLTFGSDVQCDAVMTSSSYYYYYYKYTYNEYYNGHIIMKLQANLCNILLTYFLPFSVIKFDSAVTRFICLVIKR